jgi:hypothetical protein
MPDSLSDPLFTSADALVPTLAAHHVAVLAPDQTAQALDVPAPVLASWSTAWQDLPIDQYLKDGGRYRKRRHGSYVVQADTATLAPHRAHWQPLEYNALHGGMTRWFEPLQPDLAQHPHWLQMLVRLGAVFSQVEARAVGNEPAQQPNPQPWFVEAHQFRIDTEGGIGRPTPEGAHRDGVDYVVVILVGRYQLLGGESRVFEAHGRKGERFTLSQPWTMVLLDDHQVIHETTPIRPLAEGAYRDTLVLTYRRHSFQDAQ